MTGLCLVFKQDAKTSLLGKNCACHPQLKPPLLLALSLFGERLCHLLTLAPCASVTDAKVCLVHLDATQSKSQRLCPNTKASRRAF